MTLAWSVAIIAAVVLVLSTTAASAQWSAWPGYEPYCPWCYQQQQQQTAPVRKKAPRPNRESRHVVHHVTLPKEERPNRAGSKPKPERRIMSVDEERASIKERVSSFCGRHPKDIACQPMQGEPSTSAQAPKEP